MTLNWTPDPGGRVPTHFRADTPHGTYRIGQRKSDGMWEYATPDEDWGDHNLHIIADLSEAQAYAAVNAAYNTTLKEPFE